MEIKNVEIKPVDEKALQHIKPALQIEVELEYKASQEMLLSIDGDIIVGRKILAPIKFNEMPDSELKPINESAEKFESRDITIKRYVEFDRELVDYIERSRDSNPERDVTFDLILTASYLENKAVLSYVTELSPSILNQASSKIIGAMHREYTPSDVNLLVYAFPYPPSTYHQLKSNLNLISSNGTGNGYIAHRSNTREIHCVIPSSKWINNYAPKLGIGNFMVMEIPFYENSDNEIIKISLNLIEEAEKAYRAWDATSVLVKCRQVVEKLKNKVNNSTLNEDEKEKFNRLVMQGRNGIFGFLSFGLHEDTNNGDDHAHRIVTQQDAEAALYFTKILVKYTAELLNRNIKKADSNGN